jgi:hypothetical protein
MSESRLIYTDLIHWNREMGTKVHRNVYWKESSSGTIEKNYINDLAFFNLKKCLLFNQI